MLDCRANGGRAEETMAQAKESQQVERQAFVKMPNGQQQEPGGWNRVVLKVADLPGFVNELKKAGLRFRNEMESGPGGRQIQVEDPDGNPIELFEPAR